MKLGFITAICDGMNFEEVVDFAAENGLECLEIGRASCRERVCLYV